jgi:NifU-like protein
MIKGLNLDTAGKITNEDIADFLGGLPHEKIHCSVMGRDALERAIADFRGIELKVAEGEIVCKCFSVTDLQIERAVKEGGLATIEDVVDYVKAGGGCGECHDKIQEMLDAILAESAPERKTVETMTNLQKIKLIEATLEKDIKPALIRDGGDIELVDVDGNKVMVKMVGTCASCARSQMTLKNHVEATLRERVAYDLVVEEVS